MVHASLFSGIGGFDLAAEYMGWENAFHCEINEWCSKILKYYFPNSEHYEDITKTDFSKWKGRVDILTGGFPCQPFSLAGQRKGANDERYLWPEMLRAIREIRPAWVVGENVAGILTMVQPGTQVKVEHSSSLFGESYTEQEQRQQFVVETICQDLEQEGYSVQPLLIPACAVGAPHRRDRIWFVAHRADTGIEGMQREGKDGIHDADDATDTDINRYRDRKNEQIEIEECEGAANNCIISKAWITPDTERIRGNKVDHQVQPEQSNGNRADGNGCKRIATDTDGKRCDNGAIIGKKDVFVTTKNGTPRKVNQNGQNGSLGLARYVQMLPTPQARDFKGQCAKTQSCLPNHFGTSRLNPLFVAEMMGFPADWTVLPFLNGEKKA